MRKVLFAIVFTIASSIYAMASEGLIQVKSAHSVKDTGDKLVSMLEKKGMTVFIRIDHAAGAKKVNKTMNCSQNAAIDFPQKALIAEDKNGIVTLSYNDPMYLAKRHNIQGCDKVLNKISGILANFAKGATK